MHTQKLQILRERLNALHDWPSEYLFKFILPADGDKEAELLSIIVDFIDIQKKESKQGKYVSYSIMTMMGSADQIFEIYLSANKIEGVIAL